MDLKNLKVQELNAQEVQTVEGGVGPLGVACAVLAVVYLASTCYGLSQGKKYPGQPR